jgi:ornithine decarboxylase
MEVDFLSFERAEELAAKHGTPLLVVSRAKLKDNYLTLRDSLPNVDLFYAVKANPHAAVVKAINDIGGRFDISSVGEFELTRRLKVTGDRLVYTQPIKKPEEIEYLSAHGVDLFVYDNEEELYKIKKAAPGARLLLRIATANPHCVVNLNYKFGAEPGEAEGLIGKAAAMGLAVKGIAFHVGSQSANYYAYVDTILTCKRIYDLVALKGMKMDILDIGGGFPVKYLENIMPIHRFCEPINDALNNYFMGTRIIAEPGRVICGDAAVLITRVVGKSIRNAVQWYYIDDGLYNSFSGKVYDHADYEIVSKRRENPGRCVLAGPTCDSFDVISSDIVLPELSIGDLLLVPSMGAYTNVSATEFNLLPRTKIVTID